uniref:F-box domain-containing protein n=1 Tax=Mycena chlorophos TaxID=658473 RepID=A0ABQ0LNR8_MYCCL|nr:predicted protein [Mycena chlorophos]
MTRLVVQEPSESTMTSSSPCEGLLNLSTEVLLLIFAQLDHAERLELSCTTRTLRDLLVPEVFAQIWWTPTAARRELPPRRLWSSIKTFTMCGVEHEQYTADMHESIASQLRDAFPVMTRLETFVLDETVRGGLWSDLLDAFSMLGTPCKLLVHSYWDLDDEYDEDVPIVILAPRRTELRFNAFLYSLTYVFGGEVGTGIARRPIESWSPEVYNISSIIHAASKTLNALRLPGELLRAMEGPQWTALTELLLEGLWPTTENNTTDYLVAGQLVPSEGPYDTTTGIEAAEAAQADVKDAEGSQRSALLAGGDAPTTLEPAETAGATPADGLTPYPRRRSALPDAPSTSDLVSPPTLDVASTSSMVADAVVPTAVSLQSPSHPVTPPHAAALFLEPLPPSVADAEVPPTLVLDTPSSRPASPQSPVIPVEAHPATVVANVAVTTTATSEAATLSRRPSPKSPVVSVEPILPSTDVEAKPTEPEPQPEEQISSRPSTHPPLFVILKAMPNLRILDLRLINLIDDEGPRGGFICSSDDVVAPSSASPFLPHLVYFQATCLSHDDRVVESLPAGLQHLSIPRYPYRLEREMSRIAEIPGSLLAKLRNTNFPALRTLRIWYHVISPDDLEIEKELLDFLPKQFPSLHQLELCRRWYHKAASLEGRWDPLPIACNLASRLKELKVLKFDPDLPEIRGYVPFMYRTKEYLEMIGRLHGMATVIANEAPWLENIQMFAEYGLNSDLYWESWSVVRDGENVALDRPPPPVDTRPY